MIEDYLVELWQTLQAVDGGWSQMNRRGCHSSEGLRITLLKKASSRVRWIPSSSSGCTMITHMTNLGNEWMILDSQGHWVEISLEPRRRVSMSWRRFDARIEEYSGNRRAKTGLINVIEEEKRWKKTSSKLFVVPYMLWIALLSWHPWSWLLGQSFFNIDQFSLENYKSYFASQNLTTSQNEFNSVLYARDCNSSDLSTINSPLFDRVSSTVNSGSADYPAAWINLLLKAYAFIGIFGEISTLTF